MVNILLSHNLDINLQDNYGKTALFTSVFKKFNAIAQALLSKKADPNIKENNGWIALLVAVDNNDIDIIKLLLANGANVNSKNRNIEIAKSLKQKNIPIEIIIETTGLTKEQIDKLQSYCETPIPCAQHDGIGKL